MDRPEPHRTVIHRHSGWLVPLAFILALLALSGAFLAWYLRPGPHGGAPSRETATVTLSVRGLRLAVPANYIETAAARRGGEQNAVTLFALYPSFRGYSEADADLFAGNAAESPVIPG